MKVPVSRPKPNGQPPTPPGRWWRRCAGVLAAVWAVLPGAQAQEVMAPLTSLPEVWALDAGVGPQERPLRLRAAVHYADPEWRMLFLQVGQHLGYFTGPGPGQAVLRAGQVVDLVGFVRADRRTIVWERTKVTVVPGVVFPAARALALPPEGEEAGDDQQVAEVEGLVGGQQEVDRTHLRFDLIVGGAVVVATVHLRAEEPVPQLAGCRVRLRAVCTVKRDAGGSVAEISAWVAESGHIRILGRLSEDVRFERALTAVENLGANPAHKLVRVAGSVHSQEPGQSLTLRDATGQVKLLTRQTQRVKIGERVEAIGRPDLSGVEPQLREALFRPQAASGAVVAAGLAKLRLTEHIRELRPDEAALGYPVALHGVVTWSDAATHSFFLQDASGGVQVFVPAGCPRPLPLFAEAVFVRGQTRTGEFAPVVESQDFAAGGNRTFPAAREVTYEQAMTGREYGRWIELRGFVRAVSREKGRARLVLATSGGEFVALAPPENLPSGLEGAVVRLHGVCGAATNERRQLVGLRMLISSVDDIQVVEPVPEDLFATPRTSIGSLRQFRVGHTQSHREQVSGVVLLHRPGQYLCLQDGPDRIFVLTRQEGLLQPGELVDVVGFPGHESWRLILREAVFRRTGRGPEPAPLPLPQPGAVRTELDGALVQIHGTLLSVVPQESGTRWQIQAGSAVFAADWSGPASLPGVRPPEPGSTVAVTGIYRVELDEYRQPRGFLLNLRNRQDLAILSRPSWWTAAHIAWVTAGLLTAALFAAAWGLSLARKNRLLRAAEADLRRVNEALEGRVEERTRELAAERDLLHMLFANSPDQIYFKDRESRFVRCSQAVLDKLRVAGPEEVIGKSDADFFAESHARLTRADEQRIIETGEPLIGKIEKEMLKEDGGTVTWVLTTKVPQRDKAGAIIGTFGISKDITAIKEAEEKLAAIHRELLETSRRAGMAEVATSVLHNVGNVLNSVNISCTVITETVRKSRLTSVARAASLLQEHREDLPGFFTHDPAGQKLPDFLSKLAQKLAAEQATVVAELGLLSQNIEHIKEIVAMQQSYGRVSGVTETTSAIELVEDSLRMNQGALTRHEVRLVREFAEVPPLTVEKHKVLQILVNLIRNAKYACDAAGRPDKCLTVRVGPCPTGVAIAVCDNGIGIPAENLTRIFSHGFTTKKEGHGFGLHSAVLCAQDLGGRLRVESAGPGCGATFTLELPLQPTAHA